MAGKRRDRKQDDEPDIEDTQPLVPGMPTRRDVITFARRILEKNPPRREGGPPRG